MALLPATLASQLIANLDNFETEAQATAAWAASFDTYFQSAMAGLVPVTPLSTVAAKNAMAGALTGMSADDAGADAIVAGITAYWSTLSGSPSLIFAASTAIAPPAGLAGLSALLLVDFTANSTGMVAKAAALTTIANTIHTAQSGGTATFPAPVGVQTIA